MMTYVFVVVVLLKVLVMKEGHEYSKWVGDDDDDDDDDCCCCYCPL